MHLTIRRNIAGSSPLLVISKLISRKYYREKMLSVVTKGFHIRKYGRLIELNCAVNDQAGNPMICHLSFTESEIFQLAQWCKGKRSDEELLKSVLKQE